MTIAQRLKATIEYALENGIDGTKVPEKEFDARMKKCGGCEHFWHATAQCGVCKCFMKVKARLMYDPVESVKQAKRVHTVCPMQKWGAFISTNSPSKS